MPRGRRQGVYIDGTEELINLGQNFRSINVNEQVDESMQEVFEDEFIPLLVERIKQKGLTSDPYNESDGPPLASEEAWSVTRIGNAHYRVEAIDPVEERAFYLEYGTVQYADATKDGEPAITADGDRMVFQNQEGETIYPMKVKAVYPYSFFRETVQSFNATGRLAQKVEDDLADHIRENVFI